MSLFTMHRLWCELEIRHILHCNRLLNIYSTVTIDMTLQRSWIICALYYYCREQRVNIEEMVGSDRGRLSNANSGKSVLKWWTDYCLPLILLSPGKIIYYQLTRHKMTCMQLAWCIISKSYHNIKIDLPNSGSSALKKIVGSLIKSVSKPFIILVPTAHFR